MEKQTFENKNTTSFAAALEQINHSDPYISSYPNCMLWFKVLDFTVLEQMLMSTSCQSMEELIVTEE